jgi:hypothetical protein
VRPRPAASGGAGLIQREGRFSYERYRCPRAALVHYEISSARRRRRSITERPESETPLRADRSRRAVVLQTAYVTCGLTPNDLRIRLVAIAGSDEQRLSLRAHGARGPSALVSDGAARRSTSHPTALKSLVSPSPRASPAVQLSRSTRAASWACYYLVRRPPPGRHDRFEGFPFGGHGVSPGRQRRQAPARLIARRCPRARAPDARR